MRRLIILPVMLVGLGCAPHESPEASTPKAPVEQVEPEVPEVPHVQEPEPVPVDVVVSSAQMYQDCPDAEVKSKAASPAAKGAMGRRSTPPPTAAAEQQGDMEERVPGDTNPDAVAYPPPCTQSWVQLSFASRADRPISVSVVGVRMIYDRSEETSFPLTTRAPSVWDTTDGYLPWDEVVRPGDSKASYKLGAKDWALVERQVEIGNFYYLELDLEVGGEPRTVKSTTFTPQPEAPMVT